MEEAAPTAAAQATTPPPQRTSWRHLVNVLKSFIGSNYLSIPFAFAAAGIVLGPLAVFAIAAISGYGCMLLVRIRRRMQAEGKKADTYGEVAGDTLGAVGYGLVEFFLVFTQFGYCVGYTIYISTAVVQLLGSRLSQQVVIAILSPFFFALSCVPDLKQLLPFSTVSNLALLLGYVTVMAVDSTNIQRSGFQTNWNVKLDKLPLAFGNLVASFEGIGTILPVEGSMAAEGVRSSYPRLLYVTLLVSCLLFSVFGVVGYGSYGDQLCSVILTNLGDGHAADVVRVSLVVGLFFTYGFQIFPVLEVIDLKALRGAQAQGGNGSADHHDSSNLWHRYLAAWQQNGTKSAALTSKETPPAIGDGSTALDGGYTQLQSASPDRPVRYGTAEPARVGAQQAPQSSTVWLLRGLLLQYLMPRICVVALSSCIAAFVPEFELVISLVGSLGASFLAFIIPGVLALKTPAVLSPSGDGKVAMGQGDKAACVLLILVGLVGGGIGSTYSLMSLIRGHSQC